MSKKRNAMPSRSQKIVFHLVCLLYISFPMYMTVLAVFGMIDSMGDCKNPVVPSVAHGEVVMGIISHVLIVLNIASHLLNKYWTYDQYQDLSGYGFMAGAAVSIPMITLMVFISVVGKCDRHETDTWSNYIIPLLSSYQLAIFYLFGCILFAIMAGLLFGACVSLKNLYQTCPGWRRSYRPQNDEEMQQI